MKNRQYLRVITNGVTSEDTGFAENLLPCVLTIHNELRILPEFFNHYRALGVGLFHVIDDRSSDGSREWLKVQPDVLLYEPVDGSTYSQHKREWRSEILDMHCAGRWVLVPDADEHLLCQPGGLRATIASLEDNGAEALLAVMLDMYKDAPLSEHIYGGGSLLSEFPLCDPPSLYYCLAAHRRFLKKFPQPDFFITGGMRHRIFQQDLRLGLPWENHILRRLALDQPLATAARALRRLASKYVFGGNVSKLYNCTKIPLLRWRKGMFFYGGAHAVSSNIRVSSWIAPLLHYKFTNGFEQVRYIATRGAHASGARHYKIMAASPLMARSPVHTDSIDARAGMSFVFCQR